MLRYKINILYNINCKIQDSWSLIDERTQQDMKNGIKKLVRSKKNSILEK